MDLEPFPYYFVITKTLNLSNKKWKLVKMKQYYHRKKHQRLYETSISILYKMGEIVVAILHIYGVRAISLLFCNHQDTESEK